MINQSRRKLIKTLGYGIALTAGGASALAVASKPTDKSLGASLPTASELSICQQQSNGKEIVSIMNLSNKSVALDPMTPVGFEDVNGSLSVKLHQANDIAHTDAITLVPGQRFAFEVEAINDVQQYNELQAPSVLADSLKMTSDHPAFNGVIPVTAFDSLAA